MATITNCHKLGSLQKQILFYHSSGGQKPEIKVQQTVCPVEALGQNSSLSLPSSGGCQQFLAFFACGHVTPVSDFIFISLPPLCVFNLLLSYKRHIIGLRAHLGNLRRPPLKILNYTCKDPLFQISLHPEVSEIQACSYSTI